MTPPLRALLLALVSAVALAAGCATSRPIPVGDDLSALRDRFAADRGHPRLLVLASPS